jgi:hypothetical protein
MISVSEYCRCIGHDRNSATGEEFSEGFQVQPICSVLSYVSIRGVYFPVQ